MAHQDPVNVDVECHARIRRAQRLQFLFGPRGTEITPAVHDVHVGKHIRLSVEAADEVAARAQVDEMARRLLSNPVIEDFRVLETEEA